MHGQWSNDSRHATNEYAHPPPIARRPSRPLSLYQFARTTRMRFPGSSTPPSESYMSRLSDTRSVHPCTVILNEPCCAAEIRGEPCHLKLHHAQSSGRRQGQTLSAMHLPKVAQSLLLLSRVYQQHTTHTSTKTMAVTTTEADSHHFFTTNITQINKTALTIHT